MTEQPSLTEQALNIDWKSFDENAVKFIEQVIKENIELKKRVMGLSRPSPPTDVLEQTVIEELLAIEGYVNGIYYGDESPKRMYEHISTSIGVIRNVIKERESLRREVKE